MSHSETVERILDAAEQLFAERGLAETSLRLITGRAEVNLAAVNYHFGSKRALIEAVFSRVLGPFCASLERELDRRQASSSQGMGLEELLEVTIDRVRLARPGGDLGTLMRLLGLALSQERGHLRGYLEDMYGKLLRRYLFLLQESVPQVPALELFWRTHFMLSAATFTLSEVDALCTRSEERFGTRISSEQAMHLLVPFLAAGMRAESILDPRLSGICAKRYGRAAVSVAGEARSLLPDTDE